MRSQRGKIILLGIVLLRAEISVLLLAALPFPFLLIGFCASYLATNLGWTFHFIFQAKRNIRKGRKDPSHLFSPTWSAHLQTCLMVFLFCLPPNLQQHCRLIYQLKLTLVAVTRHQEHCPALCHITNWNEPDTLVQQYFWNSPFASERSMDQKNK